MTTTKSMMTLLLSTILQTYGWGKFDFASILTLLLATISLFLHGREKPQMPFWLGVYFAFWYFSNMLCNDFPQAVFPMGIIKAFLVYLMFYNTGLRLNYFIGKYRKIALVCIVFFVIQTISRVFFNHVIVGVLSFLPVAIVSDNAGYLLWLSEMDRDSSFFSEPAMFVQFLLPLLVIELFYFPKKSWGRIIAIVLTLLFLQSGNALLGLAVIAVFYLWKYIIQKKSVKSIFSVILVLIVAGIGAFVYIQSDMGQALSNRSVTIQNDSYETTGYATSGFIRIYRGYYIYNEYPLKYKIIGNDNEDYIQEVIGHSKMSWAFHDETYVNTVQAFLIYTGIIGTFFYLLFFINQWRKTNYCGRNILALLMMLSFIAALHFREIMALYLMIPFAMKKEEKYEEKSIASRV